MKTIADLEKILEDQDERIKKLENWHDTNGFPNLAYHEQAIGAFEPYVNPEFEAERKAVDKANKLAKVKA